MSKCQIKAAASNSFTYKQTKSIQIKIIIKQ